MGGNFLTILVVDDKAEIRDLFMDLLSNGYEVFTAGSGQEALELLSDHRVDLVFTDILMERMDGLMLLRLIKERHPGVEVVMMSAYANMERAIESLRRGASDFITKPFTAYSIRNCIESVLERHRLIRRNILLNETVLLHKKAQVISESSNPMKFLRELTLSAMELSGADSGSLHLLHGDVLKLCVTEGFEKEQKKTKQLAKGDCIAGWVAQNRKSVLLIGNANEDPRFRGLTYNRDIQSAMSVPLISRHKLYGVLNVSKVQSAQNFDDRDLELLEHFASEAALVLSNFQLIMELKRKIQEVNQVGRRVEKAEDKLKRTEKMATLGTLTASIAHDIKSPLGAISIYTELLEREIEDQRLQMYLAKIHENIDWIEKMSENLQAYSRISVEQQPGLRLVDAVKEAESFIREELNNKGITLEIHVAEDLPVIRGDRTKLSQVFLNLFKNAKDSIDNSGTISVTARDNPTEEVVEIRVADTGEGIEQANLEKIFYPFYTTKEDGGGTGLGLSIVQRIVELHRGELQVESELGQGTVFEIRLPRESPATAMA